MEQQLIAQLDLKIAKLKGSLKVIADTLHRQHAFTGLPLSECTLELCKGITEDLKL